MSKKGSDFLGHRQLETERGNNDGGNSYPHGASNPTTGPDAKRSGPFYISQKIVIIGLRVLVHKDSISEVEKH